MGLLLQGRLQFARDLHVAQRQPTLLADQRFAVRVEPDDFVVRLGALSQQVDDARFLILEDRLGLGQVAGERPILLVQIGDAGVEFMGLALEIDRRLLHLLKLALRFLKPSGVGLQPFRSAASLGLLLLGAAAGGLNPFFLGGEAGFRPYDFVVGVIDLLGQVVELQRDLRLVGLVAVNVRAQGRDPIVAPL